MNSLKIGISGVRGTVGETFTPELIVGFAQAFGTYLDAGRILVCRDTRSSGTMVRSAVLGSFTSPRGNSITVRPSSRLTARSTPARKRSSTCPFVAMVKDLVIGSLPELKRTEAGTGIK